MKRSTALAILASAGLAACPATVPTSPDTGSSCSAPKTVCKSACVDTQSDDANCGSCSTACTSTQSCVAGSCYLKTCSGTPACTADQVCKSGACIDKACVEANCPSGQFCKAGTCTACVAGADCTPSNPCKAGVTQCGGAAPVCVETDDLADDTSCGTGHVCRAGECVATDLCATATCDVGTMCNPDDGTCVGCLQDGDCTALPRCDPAAKKCVACLSSGDCQSGQAKACSAGHTCVQCVSDLDCASSSNIVCDKFSNTCSGCSSHPDCAGTPQTPFCSPASHHCVACVTNDNCVSDPKGPICDPATHICTTCTSNADCATTPLGGVCDPVKRLCVGCLSNPDCASNDFGRVCDTAAQRCVQCLTKADCPFEKKGCVDNFCGVCTQDSDCPGPTDICTEDDAQCHCSADTDCGGNAPICNSAPGVFMCGCTDSPQCPSGRVCDTYASPYGICAVNCTQTPCDPVTSQPYCIDTSTSPNYGVCVPCRNTKDCLDMGTGLFCTDVGCVDCRDDTDCTDPAKPLCRGACVQCMSWQDCPTGQGCNSSTQTCGSCMGGTDCPDTYPYCVSGQCVATTTDGGIGPCIGGCQDNNVCDPSTNTCVQCLNDADCAAYHAPLMHCDTAKKYCVQCKQSSDCPFSAPSCTSGFCLHLCDTSCKPPLTCGTDSLCHCTGTSDCGGDAPICLNNKSCGCDANAQCSNGAVCNPVYPACERPCSEVACDPQGALPYCDSTAGSPYLGLCMACQSDAACVAQSAAYPYCTPFGCSECRTTSDCPGSKPICRGACFQCMYPSDCTNPAAGCNSSTFTCGSCEVAADCPSGVCNGGTCQ